MVWPRPATLPAGDKRDRVHFALQARIERHEYRFGRLGSVLGRIPAASNGVQHGLSLECLLLLELIDGALHVGDRLSELLDGGLQTSDEIGSHCGVSY